MGIHLSHRKKKKVKYDAYFYNLDWIEHCATCNAEFGETKDLDEHVANVHDGKNPIKCDLCENTFARMNELNRHKNMLSLLSIGQVFVFNKPRSKLCIHSLM